MDQNSLQCALVRGGTSKGVAVARDELPEENTNTALLSLFGSPDERQIDGLGGGTSTTSKLMIIEESNRDGIDIDYEFGQVSVRDPTIDYGGNCGNMTTVVGPFAVDQNMIDVPDYGETTVTLYNKNTETRIDQSFEVVGGRTATVGDHKIHGVPGTGARVDTTFYDPASTIEKGLFPFNERVTTLDVDGRSVEMTVLDVTTPVVFVRASDLGVTGTELPEDIDNNPEFLDRIEQIRATVCTDLGIVDSPEDATVESPGFPKIAFVAPPTDYEATVGHVTESEIDITARIMSMQYLHPVYAVTGASCTAAATLLEGTIPNQVADAPDSGTVELGHPKGKMSIEASVNGNNTVESVTVSRTHRRLMEGQAFYTLETNGQ
ncbi:PrpF protein [Haloferax sp. Atlit-4N]|uniref:2-methylaconitate cis-trans isomerase PrpF family protein n=1 Tax=Haloferax sp. Atlit-4N TaxID=2077206 RepID=UPI000E25DEB4|nr:PrpF domain-containing protein [Haloferax sp. Atlit-4N]RDZ50239.1 PrpF protein [Haloferax sp. Atlit-4N]